MIVVVMKKQDIYVKLVIYIKIVIGMNEFFL
jgi:hypothetical protein